MIRSDPPIDSSIVELLSKRATSIDEVIDRLTAIINWSLASGSRLGYFPAMYRKVTLSIRDGIRQNMFDDGNRMERFDVIFANRYLDAFNGYCSRGHISSCWQLAFDSAVDYWPIILQHLLLGMNAHINLDLGIAAAETMHGFELKAIRSDFNRINEVLSSLVDDVQNELAAVWKPLRVLSRVLGTVDNAIVNFSMKKARDEAWRSAQTLSTVPPNRWPEFIPLQDKKAMVIGSLVRSPGPVAATVTKVIRIGEIMDVRQVIEILC